MGQRGRQKAPLSMGLPYALRDQYCRVSQARRAKAHAEKGKKMYDVDVHFNMNGRVFNSPKEVLMNGVNAHRQPVSSGSSTGFPPRLCWETGINN